MIDLFFVKTFVTVAQTGSFKLAAQKNNITQPAVSQHIRLLEQKFGCRLLDRSLRKTTLSAAGKIFFIYAQQMLKAYQNAQIEIEKMNSLVGGSIRIASTYSIGLYQLKPLIQHFLKEYPKINIHLEYAHNSMIYQMVQENSIDFGMVAFPKVKRGLQTKIFKHDPLVLIQPPRHRFFKKNKKVRLPELNNIPFIGIDVKTPTGHAIDQFFKNHLVYVHWVETYDNIETIKNAVETGLGVSILPKTTILQNLKDSTLETVSLTGFNLKRPLGLIYNNKKAFTKAARIFLQSF